MAVRIRLTRMGRKHTPAWRIAVFDSKTRRDGKYIEFLGNYYPEKSKSSEKVVLKSDRFAYWWARGARPTDGLSRILKHAGVALPT